MTQEVDAAVGKVWHTRPERVARNKTVVEVAGRTNDRARSEDLRRPVRPIPRWRPARNSNEVRRLGDQDRVSSVEAVSPNVPGAAAKKRAVSNVSRVERSFRDSGFNGGSNPSPFASHTGRPELLSNRMTSPDAAEHPKQRTDRATNARMFNLQFQDVNSFSRTGDVLGNTLGSGRSPTSHQRWAARNPVSSAVVHPPIGVYPQPASVCERAT